MSVFHNNALIGASGQAGAGPSVYSIERSLRFNSSDSAYLSRTLASAGNRKTWTWSAWIKRNKFGTEQALFGPYSSGYGLYFLFNTSDGITLGDYPGGSYAYRLITTQVFRDPSAWFHLVVALDTTQATASNRLKMYVNGVQITAFSTETYPSQNYDGFINSIGTSAGNTHYLGSQGALTYGDFYLADIHFIDGQALDPTSFGEFDTNGVWQPIAYSGTYGTNGFHLPFSDNSTAAALGTDTSGNSNTWTVNNLSVAAGADNDSLVDTPTNGSQADTGVGGEVVGNYATWNPLDFQVVVPTNGNLDTFRSAAPWQTGRATFGLSAGKWYWETTASSGLTLTSGPYNVCQVGISKQGTTGELGVSSTGWGYYSLTGNRMTSGTNVSYGATWTTGDVIGVAFDADNGTLTFYKNGVSQGQAFSGLTSGPYFPSISQYSDNGSTCSTNFGQRPFAYTAPSGFKALCTTNLPAPDPSITPPSKVMDVLLWTGTSTSSARTISGLQFSPDLVWTKGRSQAYNNQLWDVVRGTGLELVSNSTAAELTNNQYGYLSAFNSDGFSATPGSTDNSFFNELNTTYVAWTWDAGSSTVSNTDGSITSQVRANPSAGFSIVSFNTGASTTNQSVGHGLNDVPQLIITKDRDTNGTSWHTYHAAASTALTKYLVLNSTSGVLTNTSNMWGASFPTSSVFGITVGQVLSTSKNAIAYCFAPVAGYSSFGSYTGNGSTDGPFVYTGFRPRWVVFKQTNTGGQGWFILDTSRSTYNVASTYLLAQSANAEVNGYVDTDFCSNGFKIRSSDGAVNASGGTYIYAAFAESPFQFSRAR